MYHYWGEPQYGYYLSADPWVLRRHAQLLADAGVAPGLAVAPIDLGHAQRVRAQMPSLQHRRPALF